MKKFNLEYGLLLCVILSSCGAPQQSPPSPSATVSQVILPTDETHVAQPIETSSSEPVETTTSKPIELVTYIQAYTDFLLNSEIDSEDDLGFPIRGYYLFDLDFDQIPELGVLHDSMGSMGGYFKFYRFDGEGIVPIQARCSNYT